MARHASQRTGVARALVLLWVAVVLGGLAVGSEGRAAETEPASGATPESPAALPEAYPWIRLAEALTPAVVNVRTTGEASRIEQIIPEPFRRFFPPEFRERTPEQVPRRGLGTGFVIDPDGYIVTNHHVVAKAKSIEVTLSDGRKLDAELIGSDPETDLALIKIEASDLPTITFGRSTETRVGEPVMAIGNPFGLDHTVTVGIISAKSRVIGAGRYDDFLQTDAAINPGNSGGPLINTRGEAVGIATAIASRSGGFQGIGFAIPIDLAKPILQQLRSSGEVTRGWLGVMIQPLTPELAKSFDLASREGALVASVVEGSPAAQAGLKPGDVIVRYGDDVVEGPRQLSTLVGNTKVGRTMEVGIVRDGHAQTLTVTIGNLAESRLAEASEANQAVSRLGVQLQELTPELARQLGVKGERGVVVTDVRAESPAARAGLAEGDVIREVNRRPIEAIADVEEALASQLEGGEARALLRVERQGAARFVVVELG